MLSKRELLPYALIILLVIVLLWRNSGPNSIQDKINAIENSRRELQDSIQSITTRFNQREAKLLDAIRKDLDLVDQLGEEIRQLRKDSKSIELRIKEHKKEIDRLWNVEE